MFIDELDAVGGARIAIRRTPLRAYDSQSVVRELDGYKENEEVIVIG